MSGYGETLHVARIREIAPVATRAIRKPLRFNTWAAIEGLYLRPYMTRHRPISARDRYQSPHMINGNIVQIEYGISENALYLRAPMDITSLTNGKHP